MFERNFSFVKHRPPARGTTLIELMLSLTLSVILLGLVVGVYLATEKQNELLAALVDLHDHARFALQRLEQEVRQAGFIGCPRLTADFPLGNATAYPLNAANKVELRSDEADSSVMTIRHRRLEIAELLEPMTQASILDISLDLDINVNDLLLISDCRHADLFQVEEVSKRAGRQRLRARSPLRYRYAEGAEIGEMEIRTYSLEKTGRKDSAGEALFALFVRDRNGHKSEWATGGEKWKVEILAGQAVSFELQVAERGLHKTEYGFVALRN